MGPTNPHCLTCSCRAAGELSGLPAKGNPCNGPGQQSTDGTATPKNQQSSRARLAVPEPLQLLDTIGTAVKATASYRIASHRIESRSIAQFSLVIHFLPYLRRRLRAGRQAERQEGRGVLCTDTRPRARSSVNNGLCQIRQWTSRSQHQHWSRQPVVGTLSLSILFYL